jgi:Mlc titration factor MtfA (ptsG expression regulator)
MSLFRNWSRRRALARTAIEPALWDSVSSGLAFLRGMEPHDLARLKELCVLFLHEKEMHGAGGMDLSDDVRLSIAVQACIPVLNLGLDVYDGWVGIIVYPREFRVTKEEMDEDGVVHRFDDALSGEAWPGGPVVLSWEDVTMTGAGYNVVIHEFAHKIHMLREDDDEYPRPFPGMDAERWRDALERSYQKFCRAVDSGVPTLVDPYAAEHPAEFFAVMSEVFFTDAAVFARDWPELYEQFSAFYRQDPAGIHAA